MNIVEMATAYARDLSDPGINLAAFSLNLRTLPFGFWWHLGQARSKCEHIGRAPLSPEKWAAFHEIYLIKGVHSTTAIEGNTLTEEEVLRIYRSELTLPPSRQYQETEVRNVITTFNAAIAQNISRQPLSVEELNGYNATVLADLESEAHVVRGEFRLGPVTVGRYRCPPADHVPHYMEKFVDWYNGFPDKISGLDEMSTAIIKAVAAHVYFVLIHPYGDGNGRTARLLEWRTLDHAGIATPATHLLSNHYNFTRTYYYRALDKASLEGETDSFLMYALQGFVDQLNEQLTRFHSQYAQMVYAEVVHAKTLGVAHNVARRRQELAKSIARSELPIRRAMIRTLTPDLSSRYAHCTEKTVSRDVTVLKNAKLIQETSDGLQALSSMMYWQHRRDQVI